MIDAMLTVMGKPATFLLITLFAVIGSCYAALTVEVIDMIRLMSLAILNLILFGVQVTFHLIHRTISRL